MPPKAPKDDKVRLIEFCG